MDDQNKTEGQRLVDRKELLDAQLCMRWTPLARPKIDDSSLLSR
jgi:hypothetical protein